MQLNMCDGWSYAVTHGSIGGICVPCVEQKTGHCRAGFMILRGFDSDLPVSDSPYHL